MNIEMGAKLSETIEQWTSLGTSHGERTVTGEEREEEKQRMARCSEKFCEHSLTTHLAITFKRAHERAMTMLEREQMLAFRSRLWLYTRTELFRQESAGRIERRRKRRAKHRYRQLLVLVVNIEISAQLSETIRTVEELST